MQDQAKTAPLIAIVDDEPDVRITISRGLKKRGYRVHPIASGASLLEVLHYQAPDCILLDLRMPGLDGMATFKSIPAHFQHIPVIFFTSHGDISLAVEAIQRGAADFIEKPATLARITEKIEAAMGSSKPLAEKFHSAERARELIGRLSEREQQVLRLACDGLQNKEIAYELDLSVRTVEDYRYEAIQKLGRLKLVNIAKIFEAAQIK